MSNQQAPAPWFYESDVKDSTGAPVMEGPYTSKEILKFIMDGVLKIESRIYDVENNIWAVASDVVPHLGAEDAPAAAPEPSSNWTPPPRPTVLKDTHVVDLHGENTGKVDYLALISKTKRPGESAQAANRPLQGLHQQQKSSKSFTAGMKPTTTPDQDLAHELAGATDALRSAGNFFKGHQRVIFTAAGLALVFVGSFSLFKSMSGDKARTPATSANQPAETSREAAQKIAVRPTTDPIQMKDSGEIGSGRKRISRASGGVSDNAPAPMQAAINNNYNRNENTAPQPYAEPPRVEDNNAGGGAAPQFYSSSDDDPNRGVAGMENMPPPQPPQGDPGSVMPPGYMPPPQDPNMNGAPPSTTF